MATAKKATKAKRAPSKATKTTTTRVKTAAPKRAAAAKTPTQSQTFFTFRATHETVYWLVLGVVVVLMAIWVLTLTIRVQNLYNQIEINNATDGVMTPAKNTHKQ